MDNNKIHDEKNPLLSEENLKSKLTRNGLIMYFLAFVAAPAWYVMKILLAQKIWVEDIGLFYSVLWLIIIISAYNDLWLTEALQYYLPHYLIDTDYVKAKTIIVFTFLVQLISAILVWTILFFLSGFLATSYFHSEKVVPLLIIFSCYFLILNFWQVIQSIFLATQNLAWNQIIEIIRLWSVVFLILSWFVVDLNNLALGRVLGASLSVLVWWIFLAKKFWWLFKYKVSWDKNLLKVQSKYALWVLIWTSVWTLLGQINQQLAIIYFWQAAAAQWAYYLSFFTIISIFTGPIISYLFPLLNELYKKNDQEKIKLIYKYLTIGVIVFWIIWGLIWYFFAPRVAVLLFWQNFLQAWEMFKVFSPFIFLVPLSWILFSVAASLGLVKQRVFALIIWLVANIIFAILLPKTNINFLIWCQLSGYIITNFFVLIYIKNNLYNKKLT